MIISFKDKRTEKFAKGTRVAKLQSCENVGARKLARLQAATNIEELRYPPGNNLEALKGDRTGQYSIRINQQWRICFKWPEGSNGPTEVEITDYH